MSTEYPPSSPFLAAVPESEDQLQDDPFHSFSVPSKKLVLSTPFNKEHKNAVKAETFPTPNPSSSAGARDQDQGSSSPPRTETAVAAELLQHPLIRTEVDFQETPDSNSHKVVNTQRPLKVLLYPNEKVTLGRSSRCDYFMKSKFASRVHIKLQYSKEHDELTVFCKGSNALYIQFHKQIFGRIVKDSEDVYYIETKPSEDCDDDEVFTEIKVVTGEQFTVPYDPELTIRVMDYQIMVDVTSDESETEDEKPVLSKSLSHIEPTQQMKEVEPDYLQTPTDKSTKLSKVDAPTKCVSKTTTPILKSSVSEQSAHSSFDDSLTPSNKVSEAKKERTPLQPMSANDLNKEQQSKAANHEVKNRRVRKAEPGLSPVKKKVDRLQPREKIESMNIEQILETVEEVDSIQNVVTNHLAFSRLSQTPLAQLQTVSASTQNLTRQQLRAVLAACPHIGVIYRRGKDAAGKYLDEEYYYDVEKDADEERVKLVNTVKGGGLRSCRKTHKQYFWKKPGASKK